MLNAVGKAQNILLLGGTSEIGISIVSRFLKQGPSHVTLAARKDSPRVDAAVAEIKAAGAASVTVVDFDALDTESHPAAIDAAFENGDVDVAIVAFGILGDNEAQWRDQALAVEATTVNYTAGVSVGVLLGQKFEQQGHGTIVALSLTNVATTEQERIDKETDNGEHLRSGAAKSGRGTSRGHTSARRADSGGSR